jgi:glucose dehydrogenase
VWGNNQLVIVLSAEAHFPPVPGATGAPETYSVTLVARTDIYSNLRKLYSGVTDKFHLDVTPRMELIDAVDADGDGRGELLFHETSDAGSGYVIYRATGDKLWKMFDSLAAE